MKKSLASIFGFTAIGFTAAACSSSDSTTGSSCASFPIGVYDTSSYDFEGDTGLCPDVASALNKATAGRSHGFTISKVSDTSYEVDDGSGAPDTYTFNSSSCTLTRSSNTTSDARDQANKLIKLTTAGATTVSVSGDTLTMEADIQLSSETTGALGVPCAIYAKASARKTK